MLLGGEQSMFEEKKCEAKKNRCCIDLIIFILSILFAFVVGIIVGALTGIIVLLSLGSFIVLAVILAILILIRTITLICCKQKKCC